MRKAARTGFGARLIVEMLCSMVLMAEGGFAPSYARGEDETAERLRVSVRVHNYAPLSGQSLQRGENEAARIFRKIGVEVCWDPAAAEPSPDAECSVLTAYPRFELRIAPSFAPVRGVTDGDSAGLAFANQASVSFRQIGGEAAAIRADPAELLGPVIAHELGHLLLGPNSHSSFGIMQARWSRDDYRRAVRGQLDFTPQEGERMRAEIRERVRTQGAGAIASK